MRYLALCCDYDGTLATEGKVFPETAAALEQLIASGRRLILVTGRELDELKTVCPYLDRFEYVVAENGALLYEPSTRMETPLARRPPDSFVAALRARGVGPISVGRVIVATWEPHETAVLETIRDHGLELQVIFNKGAVMILPAGVNKATGLSAALRKMRLSPHNAVGIGDAENDHALLGLCECGVAVANALPTLKEEADFVTTGERGAGVTELIQALLRDDLASHEPELSRHHIALGVDAKEQPVCIRPYGENILLTGATGSANAALTAALLEALAEAKYTFCVIDPEADYETIPGVVSLGMSDRPPAVEEILKLLRSPEQSAAINLSAIPDKERRSFMAAVLPELAELRLRTGRPHWLIFSCVGSNSPENSAPTASTQKAAGRGAPETQASRWMPSQLQIATRPSLLTPSALADVNLLIATGNSPERMIQEFCEMTQVPAPRMDPVRLQPGEALAWRPQARNAAAFKLQIKPRSQWWRPAVRFAK